jgi:hypothetical protein
MSINIFNDKDDFLYFDVENEIVSIKPAALKLAQVKDLFNRDKSNGKKYAQKCIEYCYYLNHKDSPIAHLQITRKREEMQRMSEEFKKFDYNNIYYLAFEELFVTSHYSRIELRYIKLIKEIDNISDQLSDVPVNIYKKVVQNIECPHCNGMVEISEKIAFDNSKNKIESISFIAQLDKLELLLKSKIELEYKNKKISQRRLFDVK